MQLFYKEQKVYNNLQLRLLYDLNVHKNNT